MILLLSFFSHNTFSQKTQNNKKNSFLLKQMQIGIVGKPNNL